MRIKKFRVIATLALALSTTFLGGCFDLGDFEDEEDYYDSFGNVGLISQDGAQTDYSLEDYFYNKESVNDFAGDIVSADEYIYFVLPMKKDVRLDSVALYVYAEKEERISYSFFIVQEVPDNIRSYGEYAYEQAKDENGDPKFDEEGNPVYEQEKDENGNPVFNEDGSPVFKELLYDDPPAEEAVCEGSCFASEKKWSSFTADKWKTSETETSKEIVVSAGEYILIRFENNSGYGRDAGYEKISFRTTNLLVRVV